MKAVILAGGRGSRFGTLTHDMPKPLIPVAGKPLVKHVIDALPEEVSECIIVLGYRGDQIRHALGGQYERLRLKYVYQAETGTGGALLAAEQFVKDEQDFFVVGSDDIYGKGMLRRLLRPRPSYGIYCEVPRRPNALSVIFDCNCLLDGFNPVLYPGEHRFVGVGAYVLPPAIFAEKFFRLPNGELSLPHTLPAVSFPVEVVLMKHWLPVNTVEEKEQAEAFFAKPP